MVKPEAPSALASAPWGSLVPDSTRPGLEHPQPPAASHPPASSAEGQEAGAGRCAGCSALPAWGLRADKRSEREQGSQALGTLHL